MKQLQSFLIILLLLTNNKTEAKTYNITNATEYNALPELSAGDIVILSSNNYKNVNKVLTLNGTKNTPVLIYSAVAGEAKFTGKTYLSFKGQYGVIAGLRFDNQGGPSKKGGIINLAKNSKSLTLTNCMFRSFNAGVPDTNWLFIEGYNHLIEFCSFEGKTTLNSTISLKPTEGNDTKTTPRNHRLQFCYFGPRTEIGDNGYEAIRISDSSKQDFDMNCTFENNYFYQAIYSNNAKEIEVISNKSRGNIYRANVQLDHWNRWQPRNRHTRHKHRTCHTR